MALDYNIPPEEECVITPGLEHLINYMTLEGNEIK